MATKKTKSPEQLIAQTPIISDSLLSVTLRADNAYEYNIELPRSIIDDIFDPTTPTRFVEVPAQSTGGQVIVGAKRYLNTAYVKEIDVRGM